MLERVELCARAAGASGALVGAACRGERDLASRRPPPSQGPATGHYTVSPRFQACVASRTLARDDSRERLSQSVDPGRTERALEARPRLEQDGDGALELHTTKGRLQGTPRRRRRVGRAKYERARRLTARRGPTGARSTGSRSSPCRAAPCAHRGCSASLRASRSRDVRVSHRARAVGRARGAREGGTHGRPPWRRRRSPRSGGSPCRGTA